MAKKKLTKAEREAQRIMAALGEAFVQQRKAAGVTQDDLVAALGVAKNTIRWHEMGKRMLRADKLFIAAKRIGCDPGALMRAD